MPDQMFAFTCDRQPILLIGASSTGEAIVLLNDFLVKRPNMPRHEEWRLIQVCGKLDDGIFSLSLTK